MDIDTFCLAGASAKPQQPAFPTVTNVLVTSSPNELAEIRAKADTGDTAAQFLVGQQYAWGDGVPRPGKH